MSTTAGGCSAGTAADELSAAAAAGLPRPVRLARCLGASDVFDDASPPDLVDDASLAELDEELAAESVPVSAKATAVPPTIAAPIPSVTAPAPSHA
jgi:hypothetical protein